MNELEFLFTLCLACFAVGWTIALVVNDLTKRK